MKVFVLQFTFFFFWRKGLQFTYVACLFRDRGIPMVKISMFSIKCHLRVFTNIIFSFL